MAVGRSQRDARAAADGRHRSTLPGFVGSTALLTVAWTLPAATTVVMDILFGEGVAAGAPMWTRIVANAVPWYLWVPLTPAVVRLARRRPVMRPLSLANIAAHTALWAAVTLAFAIALRVTRAALGLPPSQAALFRSALGWAPFTLLAYAAVAALAQAAMFAKHARDGAIQHAVLAEQLARAQLDALRVQLQPHFLFNALNTVSMLVRDHDADSAIRLIAELGDILRELLRDSTAAEAPLGGEIDLVRRYLGIEQVRFGDRLKVEWRVESDVLDAAVPPLILQPLVENAIRHGIARVTGAGVLRIEAFARADTLVLCVSDNGPNTCPVGPVADDPRAGGHRRGLGLTNTRARLERMYGDRAYLRLARTEDRLTLATIAMPLTVVGSQAPGPIEGPTRAPRELADPREPAGTVVERWT